MKTTYRIVLVALCLIVGLWFLPWLYFIIFPVESSDPFISYSPVSDSFVVSVSGEDARIFTVDSCGQPLAVGLTKNDRDSLVPQMYFTQLSARAALPDTVAGKHIDIPTLKSTQWVFTSSPRDINRVSPSVYPIMESRPKRIDPEDPVEVFTLDGKVRFIDMATNTVNEARSQSFDRVFTDRKFAYPVRSTNANISARKAYDEGYLLVDANGRVFHTKMQAGQPYMAAITLPEGVEAQQAFILENPDKRHIGIVVTTDGQLYVIERDGYRAVKLPIEGVDPTEQRITVFKNLFNWVIKLSDAQSSRWVAINSDDYSLLGEYMVDREDSEAERIAQWIFPVRLTFTDVNDCYARPRFEDFSPKALILWSIICIAVILIKYRRKSTL